MKSILIVEDDQALREVLDAGFSARGCKVRATADGRELSKLCQSEIPDLVITDVFMRHRDGFQIMQELRKKFPSVKIMVISGHPGALELLPMAKKLGADLTLFKPFNLQEAWDGVQSVLGPV